MKTGRSGRSSRTLASRLVLVGLVQLALLMVFAVLIALLTMPGRADGPPTPRHEAPHGDPHGPPPPRRAQREEGPPRGAPDGHPLESPWLGLGLTVLAGVLIIGSGSLLTARWIASPIAQLAKAVHALGDGDLQVRTQVDRDDELGALANAFDDMVERVKEQVVAERELVANVSHELRTPLARIRVASDLAAEGDHQAARMALVEITTDLAELELIVDNVLTTARLDAANRVGPMTLESGAHVTVSVRDVLERAKARFETLHPGRRVNLGEGDALVSADAVLLRRVFDNLLDNARKYGGETPEAIGIEVSAHEHLVTCSVRDHGPGISRDDLARVFEPFFRAERSRSREGGGVGLGLTLVKRIVERHGGTVRIESHVGDGTRVVVSLPLAG